MRLVWWAPNDDWPEVYRQATGRPPTSFPGRDWVCHSGLLCPRCYDSTSSRMGRMVTWHPVVTFVEGVPVAEGIHRVYGTPMP